MIILKRKTKYIFSLITVCFLVCLIFVGSGYLYLNYELEPTEIKQESVPYYTAAPENAGVMFDICGDRTLCYMDFEKNTLSLIFDNADIKAGEKLYGYTVDYVVNGDYDLLGGIIDIIGGIELELENEVLRYTGVQITDVLSRTANRETLRRKIIPEILKKTEENGFQKEDFLYIIENSDTNLTVPDCYYWSDYIKTLCRNAKIIN